MEKFAIGVLLGGVAGALLTANNYKMRTLVKKGQEEVRCKLDKMMDEKIDQMEENAERMTAESGDEQTKKSKKAAKKSE